MCNNFITLFNFNYLPQGLTMFHSLKKNYPSAKLWVLCMDDKVAKYLIKKKIKDLQIIHLNEIETNKLLKVKKERNFIEYCWTLTPFLPTFFFKKYKKKKVIYLDADIFFYKKLDPIFKEFRNSKKSIFITEHGFHKKFDYIKNKRGNYCVQFIIYKNNSKSKKILKWWQDRCLEWCHEIVENGKFGDQKYLDMWPRLFKNHICISKNLKFFQGPWTLDRFKEKDAIVYHFHGFKINSPNILIYNNYGFTNKIIKNIYIPYIRSIGNTLKKINLNFSQSSERFFRIKTIYYHLRFNVFGFSIKNRLVFDLNKIN